MEQERFETLLRQFLRREPRQPFTVELLDGRVIEVGEEGLSFGGGAATYLTPDMVLILFDCDEVRDIREATREAHA